MVSRLNLVVGSSDGCCLVKILKLRFGQDFCKKLLCDIKVVDSLKTFNPWARCAFGNVYVDVLQATQKCLLLVPRNK